MFSVLMTQTKNSKYNTKNLIFNSDLMFLNINSRIAVGKDEYVRLKLKEKVHEVVGGGTGATQGQAGIVDSPAVLSGTKTVLAYNAELSHKQQHPS